MIRSRLGFKVLGLCALAFGLMAVVTSAAQASEWYHLSLPAKVLLAMGDLLPELGGELEKETGSLLFTTKSLTSVKIECKSGTPKNGKLKEGGKTTPGIVKFEKCETFLNGVLSANCEPVTKGVKGVIETEEGLVLIALHKFKDADGKELTETTALVEPETGTTLANIPLGVKCAIAESVPVTGELILVDCNNEFTVHKAVHLVQEHATLHELKALGQPATLDGSANIFLTGAHAGLDWAGLHF